jgi:hypothetical protein
MLPVMKVVCLLLFAVCIVLSTAAAAPTPELEPPNAPPDDGLPGVVLAEGISQITGIGISPMLGVSSVGAWRYFRTPAAHRADLPWFCHPAAWGIGFAVLGLCFLKDVIGTAAPPLVKKPLDLAELFENKLSALVAGAAVVPLIASQFAQIQRPEHALLATPTGPGFASILPLQFASAGAAIFLLALLFSLAAFGVVWLTAHAINVLIALCPFGVIDALLKLVKTFFLGSVLSSYLIHPYLGAVVSLLIIVVAAMLAPWAFRLTVFGSVLATDTLLPRWARRRVRSDQPHTFLARPLTSAPVRSYGRLARNRDGTIVFQFRPWLVLPRRTVELPAGPLAISRGAFFPSLLHAANATGPVTLAIFPPRYRGHELTVGTHFGILDVRDGALVRGFKAARRWVVDTVAVRKTKVIQLQSITTIQNM